MKPAAPAGPVYGSLVNPDTTRELVLAALRGGWYSKCAMKANDFTPEQNEAAIRSMLFVAGPRPPRAILADPEQLRELAARVAAGR